MEPVCYKIEDASFPSEAPDRIGYWVGIVEHVGHVMSCKIWSKKSGKILQRSQVRSALHEEKPSRQIDPLFDPDHNLTTTHPISLALSLIKAMGEKYPVGLLKCHQHVFTAPRK